MITKIVADIDNNTISTQELENRIEKGINYAVLGIDNYNRIYKLTREHGYQTYYWINLNSIDSVWEKPNHTKSLKHVLEQMTKIVTITNLDDIQQAFEYLRNEETCTKT